MPDQVSVALIQMVRMKVNAPCDGCTTARSNLGGPYGCSYKVGDAPRDIRSLYGVG